MYLPELENLTSDIEEMISEKKDLKKSQGLVLTFNSAVMIYLEISLNVLMKKRVSE